MSGTYYKGTIYIGTASLEETLGAEECCTFRGSFAKLDVKSVPENVSQCQENQNNNNSTLPTHPDACVEPQNHGNSILALDLDGGDIKWYRQLGGYDVWFLSCFVNASTCPTGPNVDADLGEARMMLRTYVNGSKLDIVVAVQKSGFAWALDRNKGSLVWSTGKNFTLKPSNNITTAGGWVASGKVLWSTVNPSNATSSGPVSVANGVLFAGSTNPKGSIYAMNTRTGKILWSNQTGATVYGGMSISNGFIYV
ncbi:hypothetical protein L3X38_020289 [Prunus dulcis]|uniref:Pyrrolo-quinoline quinone repeat domain-containing protein n=1 Tax=Prunus dulcis TaxID=3755 RepID=A0AAD4WCG5_PRUDU|nr:hypothetical protein L3X38_020289 [Prunus dulcis]